MAFPDTHRPQPAANLGDKMMHKLVGLQTAQSSYPHGAVATDTAEIVSQDVQKRRLRVDVDRARRPVDLQLNLAHRVSLQNSASANAVSVVPAGMSTNCLLSTM